MKNIFSCIVLGVYISVSNVALSQETIEIVANYALPTKYYESADLSSAVVGELAANEKFEPPLLVIVNKGGFLQFEKAGKKGWVLLRSVKTSRSLRQSETCGAMPNEKAANVATSRGVGEPCKK